ncbi:MAG: GNAT family N-acetyltransferase [Gaiellaceae bacterium]
MTELETERLRLRRWRDDDLADLARINADPEFTRYLTPDGSPISAEQSAGQLERFRRHWDEWGFGVWAVEERGASHFVGRVGVQYHRLWADDPEVGWGLDPAVWGRGYATEAGAATIEHAFAKLSVERLVSIVHPDNSPSIRVQERLGIHPWQSVAWPQGGIVLEVRAVERDEWARLQSSA